MSRLLAALKHSMVNIVEKGEFVILYFILCFGFGAMSRDSLASFWVFAFSSLLKHGYSIDSHMYLQLVQYLKLGFSLFCSWPGNALNRGIYSLSWAF